MKKTPTPPHAPRLQWWTVDATRTTTYRVRASSEVNAIDRMIEGEAQETHEDTENMTARREPASETAEWTARAQADATTPTARTVPPDPERENNNRAAWAGHALTAFQDKTGVDNQDALSDLLSDLMHWADRAAEPFETFAAALERARKNYDAETLGDE